MCLILLFVNKKTFVNCLKRVLTFLFISVLLLKKIENSALFVVLMCSLLPVACLILEAENHTQLKCRKKSFHFSKSIKKSSKNEK